MYQSHIVRQHQQLINQFLSVCGSRLLQQRSLCCCRSRSLGSMVSPLKAKPILSFRCLHIAAPVLMASGPGDQRSRGGGGRIDAKRTHYDVLGLTPKATQQMIKEAYYRLSKEHHPDTRLKSEDDKDSSAVKFLEIGEAYEVLGNYQNRRMYDKGLYIDMRTTYQQPRDDLKRPKRKTTQQAQQQSTEGDSFHRSRDRRDRTPIDLHGLDLTAERMHNMDLWTCCPRFHRSRDRRDRTPIDLHGSGLTAERMHNMDLWTRQHYSETFDREQSTRGTNVHKKMNLERHTQRDIEDGPGFVLVMLGVVLFAGLMYGVFEYLEGQFDDTPPPKKKNGSNSSRGNGG